MYCLCTIRSNACEYDTINIDTINIQYMAFLECFKLNPKDNVKAYSKADYVLWSSNMKYVPFNIYFRNCILPQNIFKCIQLFSFSKPFAWQCLEITLMWINIVSNFYIRSCGNYIHSNCNHFYASFS